MSEQIFSVQDRTGSVAQLTLEESLTVEVNDTGVYHGLAWNGTAVSLDFTVSQVLNDTNFSITTMTPTGAPGNVMQSGWPRSGHITWLTGDNSGDSPNETAVIDVNPANAYCTLDFFESYHQSRGNAFSASPSDAIETAIVKSTDYIDQRFRFKGIKLLQFIANNPAFDPSIAYVDPWLSSFGFFGSSLGNVSVNVLFSPSSTIQHSEWPRQGVIDYSGDSVFGIPAAIKQATCELALRVMTGAVLQPDYDSDVVTAGGVLQSIDEQVGPIRIQRTYDTKLGLSFFPSFPHVDRILRNAGLLLGGGGRTLIR